MGVVTIEHLRARFDLGRTAAYRRVARCCSARLLQRIPTLSGAPTLIRATRHGLCFAGLDLPVAAVSPYQVAHAVVCGEVTVALEREFGAQLVRSEREVRALERVAQAPVASAVMGENPDGSPKLHRADLAVLGVRVLAIEVELTPKAPPRLEEIVRAWRRARWVDSIRYYVATGSTRAGLERAVARVHAAERIEICSLGEVLR